MSSWTFMSRWNRSSSSTSRCTREAATQGSLNAGRRSRMRLIGTVEPREDVVRSCRFEDFEDGFGVLSPFACLGAELASARLGQLVVLRAAVVLGEAPLGLDEAF